MQRRNQAHEPSGQRLGQGLGGGGGGQEAGQGHADLNRRQEVGGVGGELEHLLGFFVPLLRHLVQLGVVERDDGDFRRGKKGVEEYQGEQQQDLQQQAAGGKARFRREQEYVTGRIRVRHGCIFPLSDADKSADRIRALCPAV